MCFFLFYGMHTEPEFDYRIELYHIAKFIIYAGIWRNAMFVKNKSIM